MRIINKSDLNDYFKICLINTSLDYAKSTLFAVWGCKKDEYIKDLEEKIEDIFNAFEYEDVFNAIRKRAKRDATKKLLDTAKGIDCVGCRCYLTLLIILYTEDIDIDFMFSLNSKNTKDMLLMLYKTVREFHDLGEFINYFKEVKIK